MEKNLKTKDIVTVGVLSVIAFALFMLGGMGTAIFGNFAMYAHTALSALLAGVVFIVLCKKVPKHGVVLLYGITFSILYSFMGFWQMSTVIIPAAIIAELIMQGNGYNSNKRMTMAYIVFECIEGLHGGFFLWVLGKSGIVKNFPGMFTPEAIEEMTAIYYNPKTVTIMIVVTGIFALMGGLIGLGIYKKFFMKKKVNRNFGENN